MIRLIFKKGKNTQKIENKRPMINQVINQGITKRIKLWKEHINQAELSEPEHTVLWKECPQSREGESLTEEGQGEERA